MKKNIIFIAAFIISQAAFSQVGINNSDPKATLDITAKTTDGSKAEGVIAPRLSGDEIKAGDSKYGADQKGAIIYATSAVTSASTKTANITAAGYYYFDGTVWQKFSSGSTDTSIYLNDGTLGANRTVTMSDKTLSFNSTATTGTSHFNVDGSTFNVDAVNNKVGVGTTTPNAKLDIRTSPTSTTNPGEGIFGLGTTSIAASTAGAGALRYSTSSGGSLQFSNGIVWNTLSSTVQRSIVVARKTKEQNFLNSILANVTNWDEITDVNGDFDPSTGYFTAPRDGNYTVSFSFNFTSGAIIANSQVEAILVTSGGNDRKSVVAFPTAGTSQAGAAISFTLKLAQGETVNPLIWHSLGSTKTLRVGESGGDSGFLNFSVAEL